MLILIYKFIVDVISIPIKIKLFEIFFKNKKTSQEVFCFIRKVSELALAGTFDEHWQLTS